jgi:hypothetical protein
MYGMRRWVVAGLMGVLMVGGCTPGAHDDDVNEPEEAGESTPPLSANAPAPAPAPAMDAAAVQARIDARRDSIRAAFARVNKLKWREVWGLRRDKNAEQIARAQSLGVRVSGEAQIAQLAKQGRLVALEDSTEYWVLRKMTHSVPYMTPDGRAMLREVGRRFHARLDSLGLPRFRMKVTSALRTDETQAELRKVNPNASQTVSSHEYGTTLDVSHERFAAPAPPREASPAEWALEVVMMDTIVKYHGKELQAELGRVITEMRAEGALMVMMEDAQPVYHMTVARRFRGGR